MNNWNTLREDCLKCKKCDLWPTRTQVVFGVGNATAEVLFVGEAPGQKEDEQGEPFVGRSGKLLDTLLETVQLSRKKNIFIANIVKCRPPGNRDPKPKEREACLFWLHEQIETVKPKIVVCLGRIAAQVMIRPDFSVMKEHGEWTQKNGIHFMGTLHPAALLRNPKQKPSALQDYAALREKINELCAHK